MSVGGKGFFAAYKQLMDACKVASETIADLDYIEKVGDTDIKQLFVTDTTEIKSDVFENVKSLDGNSFVARVEKAVTNGGWADAQDLWDYIKSHRRKLRSNLDESERQQLRSFLSKKAREGTYILEQGALEDYLPEGFRAKDLEKLIAFVAGDSFWDELPRRGRNEIEAIARLIMPITEVPASA